MPPANQIRGDDRLLRQFIYGLPKVRKTAWCFRCAELGFNVIYLEGDNQGGLAISQIKAEARSRVQIISLATEQDRTVFAPFMKTFLRPNASFTWDEQARRVQAFQHDPTHSHYRIVPRLLTPNDVVVLDGWKALAESTVFSFAELKDMDLMEPPPDKKDADFGRNMYGYASVALNSMLARLHSLPCHLIVIGHSTVYEKYDQSTNPPRLVEQREQPISSSGPHARKLASEFSDVLYFKRIGQETIKIYTGGDKDRDGGCRFFPPAAHDWNDFGPGKFFDKLAWKPNGEPCKAVTWYAPGQEVPIGMAITPAATPGTPQPAPVIGNVGGTLKMFGAKGN